MLERHADSCASLETAVGDPAEQILRVAKDLNVGLIVMTTHGRGALGRWAFGSVADAVTRTSPVPVFRHPSAGGGYRHRPGHPARGCSARWFPARRGGAPDRDVPGARLHARAPRHRHRCDQAPAVEMMPTVAFDASLYEETVAQLEVQATAWLTQTAAQLQHEGVATTWAILHGSPSLAISDAVKPGDVIVMTSHGRRVGWLLGSVAEKLIRRVRFRCPSHGRSKQRGACCWRSGRSGFARFGVDSNAGIRT